MLLNNQHSHPGGFMPEEQDDLFVRLLESFFRFIGSIFVGLMLLLLPILGSFYIAVAIEYWMVDSAKMIVAVTFLIVGPICFCMGAKFTLEIWQDIRSDLFPGPQIQLEPQRHTNGN